MNDADINALMGAIENALDRIDDLEHGADVHRKFCELRHAQLAEHTGMTFDPHDAVYAKEFCRVRHEKMREGASVEIADAAATVAAALARADARRAAASSKPRIARAGVVGETAEVGQ